MKKAGLSYAELDGIGIGLSGVLDRNNGVTLFSPKLPLWVNVPVKKYLADRYKTTVELDDTSRTRAYAEYRLGDAAWANPFHLYCGRSRSRCSPLFPEDRQTLHRSGWIRW